MSELSAKELEEIYTLTFKNIPDFTDNDASRILRISDELTDLISKLTVSLNGNWKTLRMLSFQQSFQISITNYLEESPNMLIAFTVWFEKGYFPVSKPDLSHIQLQHLPDIISKLEIEVLRLKDLEATLIKNHSSVIFDADQAIYRPEIEIDPSLQEYSQRGFQINEENHTHLQFIKDAFHQIECRDFAFQDMQADSGQPFPFTFICCSSGTGKTQLPFCFSRDYPVFYFLFNSFRDDNGQFQQFIYSNFKSLSDALRLCIDRDLKIINLPRKEYITTAKVKSGKPLYTPSFIVKLLEEYWDYWKQTPKEYSWAESINFIARQESFTFKPISYSEAKNRINLLCNPTKKENQLENAFQHLPIVFIDETVVKVTNPNNFLYLRSLLRIIGVIPVFMGTNFNASNFLSQKSFDTGSREPRPTYRLYLVYKLPPISKAALLTEFNTISELVPPEKTEITDFLNKVHVFLKAERPWFAFTIIAELKKVFESVVGNNFSCENGMVPLTTKNIFVQILRKLFTDFRAVKGRGNKAAEFNYSHSSFFAAKNRMLKTERDKKEFGPDNDHPFISDLRHINRHMSFLQPPADSKT